MKRTGFVFAFMLLASAFARGANGRAAWIGVWQGELDGQPSVTLTLADDGGELGGTVVLNVVERDDEGHAHVAAIEPHVLLRTRVEGKTLSFEAMRLNRSMAPMHFSVTMGADGRAWIHCLNCGTDAPVAVLTKDQ